MKNFASMRMWRGGRRLFFGISQYLHIHSKIQMSSGYCKFLARLSLCDCLRLSRMRSQVVSFRWAKYLLVWRVNCPRDAGLRLFLFSHVLIFLHGIYSVFAGGTTWNYVITLCSILGFHKYFQHFLQIFHSQLYAKLAVACDLHDIMQISLHIGLREQGSLRRFLFFWSD